MPIQIQASARARTARCSSAPCRPHGAPDEAARAELIERFLPLARQLARRYQRGDEPLDDLIQVASLGLVKAIDRFDPSRDVAFSSFAVPTILGEIKRHFRDKTWSVRVPRDLKELTLVVDRAVATLSHDLHRPPSVRRDRRGGRDDARSRCSRRSKPPAPTALRR